MRRFEVLAHVNGWFPGIGPSHSRQRPQATAFTVPLGGRHREHIFLYKDGTTDRPARAGLACLRARPSNVVAIDGLLECGAAVKSQRCFASQ